MRTVFVILACFLVFPVWGQKKWEKLSGSFEKHFARSAFETALDDAFHLLAYAGEHHDSADHRNALPNYYVAKAYEAMGDPEKAKPFIKKAYALMMPNMAYDVNLAGVDLLYGKIETQLGYHKSASNLLAASLEVSMELFGPESRPFLQTLYAMADLEMAMAHWDQMVSLLTDALQIHERNFPLDHDYALYANYLGLLFMNSDMMQEAILYLKKALSVYQSRGMKEDLTCANAHNNLGLIYYYRLEFEDAALHFEKAASLYPGLTRGYSENYMMLLSNRASLYLGWGAASMQKSAYRALGAYLDRYADRIDLPYIQGVENMAGFHASAGNFQASEACFLRAIKARKSMSPVDQEALRRTIESLVSVCEEFYEIEKALYYLKMAEETDE